MGLLNWMEEEPQRCRLLSDCITNVCAQASFSYLTCGMVFAGWRHKFSMSP